MKLYMVRVAPNPTKVRLCIAEKAAGGTQIPIEEVPVNLIKGEQRQPEHLARNPFGTLPVLELDGGRHLIESLAIVEYLEERFPHPPLLGGDPEGRARVRELERIAETRVLVPVARVVHATKSPLGLAPSPEIAAHARTMLETGLRYFDALLADGRPWVAGAEVTVADCTLEAGLQFARFAELGLLERHPRLARWDRAYRERPAAQRVLVV